MSFIRKYTLLLLLALVSTQSHAWVSFDYVKPFMQSMNVQVGRYFSNTISSIDTGKLILNGMIFAVAGIFARLLYKHYFPKKKSIKSITPTTTTNITTEPQKPKYQSLLLDYTPNMGFVQLTHAVGLSQLEVANQMTDNGGQSASCGYHALKNGISLYRWSLMQENQLPHLSGSGTIVFFTGAESAWRKEVISGRQASALTQYICSLVPLNNGIEEDCGLKIDRETFIFSQSKIQSIYRSFQSSIAKVASEIIIQNEPYELSVDGFKKLIQLKIDELNITDISIFLIAKTDIISASIISASPCEKGNEILTIKAYLKRDATLEKYFNFPPIPYGINSGKIISMADISNALSTYNNNATNKLSLDGEWLNEAEIRALFKINKISGANNTDNDLTVLESIECLTSYDSGISNSQVINESHANINTIKTKLKEQGDFNHIFICGTMDYASASSGHWFTIVLVKKGDQKEYIVTDSLNQNRMDDDRVRLLLKILEGQEAMAAFSSSSGCVLV